MQLNHVLFVGVALTSLVPGFAKAEQHIVCPLEVQGRQITVAAPAGWKGMFRPESKTSLSRAGV